MAPLARSALSGLLGSPSGPREPPSRVAHPIDGGSFFVFVLVVGLCTLSRRGSRTGSLRRRCESRSIPAFSRECF